MAAAATLETVQGLIDSALASGDLAAALTAALRAKALMATMPDSELNEQMLRWPGREHIDGLIADIRKQQQAASTAGGIQRTNIQYARPGAAV